MGCNCGGCLIAGLVAAGTLLVLAGVAYVLS